MVRVLVPENLQEDDLYERLSQEGVEYSEASRDEILDELMSGEYDAIAGDNHERIYAAATEMEQEITVFDYGDSGLATTYLSGNPSADASSIQEVTEKYRDHDKLRERVDLGGKMVRHDTLNELNVILGRLDLAEQDASEDVKEQIEIAKNRTKCVGEIVDSTAALFSTQENKQKVSLFNILRNVEDSYMSEAQRNGFELEIDAEAGLYACAGEEIETVYAQMIRNGIEHSEGDHIQINAEETNEGVKVEYEDNGEGFDPDNMEKVLEEGVSENEEGGLGMFIMAQNAEKYDMDLILGESEDLGGAKITTILEPAEK